MTAPDISWMRDPRRHCRGMDPAIFFPEDPRGVAIAKAICRPPDRPACPFIDRCLQHALENGEKWGVYGGESMRKRVKMRTKREHGTQRGFMQHHRNSEDPCDECREAHNLDQRERKQGQPRCIHVNTYPTRETAEQVSRSHRAYQCPVCDLWHLTTGKRQVA
jgi:WhiB family redox-sensing transcriptional regulator